MKSKVIELRKDFCKQKPNCNQSVSGACDGGWKWSTWGSAATVPSMSSWRHMSPYLRKPGIHRRLISLYNACVFINEKTLYSIFYSKNRSCKRRSNQITFRYCSSVFCILFLCCLHTHQFSYTSKNRRWSSHMNVCKVNVT